MQQTLSFWEVFQEYIRKSAPRTFASRRNLLYDILEAVKPLAQRYFARIDFDQINVSPTYTQKTFQQPKFA